jgi:hypothetical protein
MLEDLEIVVDALSGTSFTLDQNNPGTSKIYRELETRVNFKLTTTNPLPDKCGIVLDLAGDARF